MKRIALSPLRSRRLSTGGAPTSLLSVASAASRPRVESRLSAQRALAVAGLASFIGVATSYIALHSGTKTQPDDAAAHRNAFDN